MSKELEVLNTLFHLSSELLLDTKCLSNQCLTFRSQCLVWTHISMSTGLWNAIRDIYISLSFILGIRDMSLYYRYPLAMVVCNTGSTSQVTLYQSQLNIPIQITIASYVADI